MHRILIPGAALAVLAAVGVPRLVGVQERLAKLDQRTARLPIADLEMRTELGALDQDLGALRARLVAAEQAGVLGEEALMELRGVLDALDERVQRSGVQLDQLAELRAEWERECVCARLEELESSGEQRWEGLSRAVEAAATLAERTSRDLVALGDDLTEPEEDVRWRAMVGPTVQLAGESTVGSGVLLQSRELEEGRVETLLLTAWHVVRDIRADSFEKDPPIPVTVYLEDGSTLHHDAELVAYETGIDAALLCIMSEEPVPCAAALAPRAELAETRIFRPMIAVGCPLGNDPIPTRGELADLDHLVDGNRYWMISAPTYIGNSGGAIFDASSQHMVGIFSKIYTHGALRPTIVPHMGLVTPLDRVYDWLEEAGVAKVIEGSDGVEIRVVELPQAE